MTFSELANFIWDVADPLRGDYKRADYGKVIPPFTLLRHHVVAQEGSPTGASCKK
jgi:type I restriction enzyme M protein